MSGASGLDPLAGTALQDDERLLERKRETLVLVLRFLFDYGYQGAYRELCVESSVSLAQVDAADNIDLLTVLAEFREYYLAKYGRPPKLIRQAGMTPPSIPVVAHPAPSRAAPAPQASTSTAASQLGLAPRQPTHYAPSPPNRIPAYQPPSNTPPQAQHPLAHEAPQPLEVPSPGSPSSQDWVAPSTCRVDTTVPLTQAQMVAYLSLHPTAVPTQLFTFQAPRRDSNKRRSTLLALSAEQEDALYCLVGCVGVGWSVRNITPETRVFLHHRFAINKELLQTFFKNRALKRRKPTPGGGAAGADGAVGLLTAASTSSGGVQEEPSPSPSDVPTASPTGPVQQQPPAHHGHLQQQHRHQQHHLQQQQQGLQGLQQVELPTLQPVRTIGELRSLPGVRQPMAPEAGISLPLGRPLSFQQGEQQAHQLQQHPHYLQQYQHPTSQQQEQLQQQLQLQQHQQQQHLQYPHHSSSMIARTGGQQAAAPDLLPTLGGPPHQGMMPPR